MLMAESTIRMNRVWAMPSPDTLSMPPFRQLVKRYLHQGGVSVDPFARNCTWATHTNDLNPDTASEHHLDALEFLKMLIDKDVKAQTVIFDPPYSLEQCKRSYESVGRVVTMRDTQIWGRWTEHKQLVAQLLEDGGHVLSFGWNSNGMGMKYGFEIVEILLAAHGGGHHDTICTVERKQEAPQGLFR